jgi:hypothetical protein
MMAFGASSCCLLVDAEDNQRSARLAQATSLLACRTEGLARESSSAAHRQGGRGSFASVEQPILAHASIDAENST